MNKQQVIADATAAAESSRKQRQSKKTEGSNPLVKGDALITTVAEQVATTDVAPRATDKQRKQAESKAAAKAGKYKHVSDGSDKRVRDAVQDHEQSSKRAGRRQSDPVVQEVEMDGSEDRRSQTHPTDDTAPEPAAPVDQPLVRPSKDAAYTGPMLALRQRLKAGVYSKSENGNPSCGDEIAVTLGKLAPAEVIRACLIALALDVNPYLHLNIGQQSMNLRNKLRGALKKGVFGMGVLREAVEEVLAERPTTETKE